MLRNVALPSFFFNDTATTEIYTLSLHDALPISLSLATVVPAVLLPARLLEYLGVGRRLSARPVRVESGDLRVSVALGCAALALTLVFPSVLHPLTWGAVWLIAEPLLYRRDRDRSSNGSA